MGNSGGLNAPHDYNKNNKINMINDTSDFFNTDDFAEFATVNNRRIKVIFDAQRVTYNTGYADISSVTPTITVQSVDIKNVIQGHSVKLRNRNYTVNEVENDGTGIAVIYLHEV